MNVASANIFVGTLYDRSENLMVANQLSKCHTNLLVRDHSKIWYDGAGTYYDFFFDKKL